MIQVKNYKNSRQYQKDANKMGKKGWKIVSVISEEQKSGCAHFLFFGIFFKPKPLTVVTYEKP